MNRRPPLILACVVLLAAWAQSLPAQEPPSEETMEFFRLNCSSCHTIGGGRLTGPDLKGVTGQQDRAWLLRFIQDPPAMIASGDPHARQLLEEAKGVAMPRLPGMTAERAGKLLDLIEAESALEKSHFVGLVLSDRPLTAADVRSGRELFEGERALQSGAPACISCHSVRGAAAFGGGLLGPDLTAVYARMEGRKALAAWLSAPPSAVMQPVFGKMPLEGEEILALVAFLKSAAEQGDEQAARASLEFLLAGFGASAAMLALFDWLWRGRFRAVRRPLVEGREG